MTKVSRVESLDYDFEDLLESFERNFAKKLAERTHPVEDKGDLQKALHPPAVIDTVEVAEFGSELALLLHELKERVLLSRQTRTGCEGLGSKMTAGSTMEIRITREVIRTEIRTLTERVRQFDELDIVSDQSSSSQRASIASLKRRLKEQSKTSDDVRRQKKAGELRVRSLEEQGEKFVGIIKMLEEQIQLLRTERGELETHVQELESIVSGTTTDKKRLERNVAMLRNELLSSHHMVSEQKLKTAQAERRVLDLEARATELRHSESMLAERVKELHEVQGKMLDEMKKVIESKDAPAARRALKTLSQQRSRIVGRIAAIMTKRGSTMPEEEDQLNPLVTPPLTNSLAAMNSTSEYSGTFVAGNAATTSEGPSPETRNSSADESRVQRRGSFLTKLRIGGGAGSSSPVSRPVSSEESPSMNRATRMQMYETNLERRREAAEKDSTVLRDMVESKTTEIARLEADLESAKSHAESLERDLHSERQFRRKENRNLHVQADEDAKKRHNDAIQRRLKSQSLFDWQGSGRDISTDSDTSPTEQPSTTT